MLYIFTHFINFLFPKAPAALLISHENPTSFLRFFNPQHCNEAIALSQYGIPQVQAAITANKFHHDSHAAHLLASLLTHWLETIPKTNYTLIPIPLSTKRLRERGHNQVTTILNRLPTYPYILINERVLTRPKNTQAQSHLDRAGRMENIKDAFTCHHDPTLDSTCFILIDDVTTTEATLRAALAALRTQYPNNVMISVALAH